MKKNILFISVLVLFYSFTQKHVYSQNRTVELEIKGAITYNELYIQSSQIDGTRIDFTGKPVNGHQWTFTIPDSVVKKSSSFAFRIPTSGEKRRINFLGVIQGDTLIGRYFNFENNEILICLKAEYHHTVHEINSQYIQSLDTTVVVQEWYADYFLIDPNQNRYLRENMTTPLGFFFDSFGTERINDYLTEFASKIKENPNSLYYISNLSSTLSYYKSGKEVELLYNLFTPEMKESFFGKKIYHYYTLKERFTKSKFTNTSLPLCNEDTQKPIIQDSSKYNLVIFSASWCSFCREEIPILKEIYNDLSQNLIMTYISLDEPSTVVSWQKLMQKENIPWRSLLAMNEVKKIKDTYFVEGIPNIILVYPENLRFEIIDVRIKEDKDRLYSLCRKLIK